ncbi:hypothetical protein NFI96_006971 [Prochilodus magdalenae]|nr:hypothetical protein NFI96_006971 [Prochilodus magdalenae]
MSSGLLSAQCRIYTTAEVGSRAVLPCDWSKILSTQSANQRPHVEWRTVDETVLERVGAEMYQGEGYKDRADVPEDKLQEGDCSLVLKNVTHADEGLYQSFLIVRRTKRSLSSKKVLLQSVELSVDEAQQGGLSENKAPEQKSQKQAIPHERVNIMLYDNNILSTTVDYLRVFNSFQSEYKRTQHKSAWQFVTEGTCINEFTLYNSATQQYLSDFEIRIQSRTIWQQLAPQTAVGLRYAGGRDNY